MFLIKDAKSDTARPNKFDVDPLLLETISPLRHCEFYFRTNWKFGPTLIVRIVNSTDMEGLEYDGNASWNQTLLLTRGIETIYVFIERHEGELGSSFPILASQAPIRTLRQLADQVERCVSEDEGLLGPFSRRQLTEPKELGYELLELVEE